MFRPLSSMASILLLEGVSEGREKRWEGEREKGGE
jgi:hypothetical protein